MVGVGGVGGGLMMVKITWHLMRQIPLKNNMSPIYMIVCMSVLGDVCIVIMMQFLRVCPCVPVCLFVYVCLGRGSGLRDV